MNQDLISIKDYLNQKGIKYTEANGELITDCVFCEKPKHLYFNVSTSQYDCKVCGQQGNIITLAKHFGDEIKSLKSGYQNKPVVKKGRVKIDSSSVERYHNQLPDRIRNYLNQRGITDDLISQYKLGYGKFYGKPWIIIPIKDEYGEYSFLKLRKDPSDETSPDKYKFYPIGSEAELFNQEALDSNDMIVICEGEFDCLILQSYGIPAITSTAGANTFKKEWFEILKPIKKIYICFDRDDAGERGSLKLVGMLEENMIGEDVYKIDLPNRMLDGKDITDYFTKHDGNVDEFFNSAERVGGRVKIDTSKFSPLSSTDLTEILGLTIKKDEENKLVTFLCELCAYTENSQFNISFNAPSSTGKSYIPTEIARLFPEIDVKEIGYCSPTAFFHDVGVINKDRGGYEVDLSRKIMIFLDQPHMMLLERLRPLLSHDKKEMTIKITDKAQKGGLKTKTIFLKGFPAVIFCSAGLVIDEQEGTRFLLLSPETNQEKIHGGISEKINKECDNQKYKEWLEGNPGRILLRERILAIRNEMVDDIKISSPESIKKIFLDNKTLLKPRHQRDIGRLISIIKAFALLNLWFRDREGNNIIANEDDIKEAMKIWGKISESQEYNLPPYVYDLYKEVILPAYRNKNTDEHGFPNGFEEGLTKQDIFNWHFKVYGRNLEDFKLRMHIIPMLETAGLISQEPDQKDKRRILTFPTAPLIAESLDNIVNDTGEENNNSQVQKTS